MGPLCQHREQDHLHKVNRVIYRRVSTVAQNGEKQSVTLEKILPEGQGGVFSGLQSSTLPLDVTRTCTQPLRAHSVVGISQAAAGSELIHLSINVIFYYLIRPPPRRANELVHFPITF